MEEISTSGFKSWTEIVTHEDRFGGESYTSTGYITHTELDPRAYAQAMSMINKNFSSIAKINGDLRNQILILNNQNKILREELEKVSANLGTTSRELASVKDELGKTSTKLTEESVSIRSQLTTVETGVKENTSKIEDLMKKLIRITDYLPRFVAYVGEYFVKLTMGVKTGQMDGIEYRPLLLED